VEGQNCGHPYGASRLSLAFLQRSVARCVSCCV